ncbi:hypothetical protein FZ934_13390 [Rhizobium grahamii]|uniref:Uncharacterized protein n=1 Tax=Rhizobium grahamii TaxID=1120045 RepID=A0A5Q0C5V7_9HYPH|nr:MULTISPECIES: hypothetical protein [Rhizobium]QFY61306.1 hypothetical protein FZ934_13390 [Rhizobium grahamii]QRM49545.1 hypothetical protein F3Y33_09500 [Rhizobium sp. BG6]
MKDPVRIGALLASAVLFALFVYLIFTGADKGQYITVAVMLVFAVVATRLDDITNVRFGATGVQAALEKKLQEAQATVTQLQRIAELFGRTSVLLISMSNRWGGLSVKEKRDAIDQIVEELRAIKVDDARIKKLLAPQRDYDRLDYFVWVTQARPITPTERQLEGLTNFNQILEKITVYAVPTIAEIEAHMRKYDILGGEAGERLKDWKQYEREGTHRRIDQWDRQHDRQK